MTEYRIVRITDGYKQRYFRIEQKLSPLTAWEPVYFPQEFWTLREAKRAIKRMDREETRKVVWPK